MFHKNITVKKPANSVVYPRNNYVYFNCEKIYIKEKKHNQNKRVLIGKMIDDEFMIPNDNARIYFPEWFENEKSPEMSDTISIGNTMVIDRIMNESGLSSLLDSIFDDDSSLIKDVMQYMIIGETTAIQHFPSFMRRIPVFSKQIYSDSSIGRLLKDRIKFRDTDLFLKSWNNMHKGDAIYISYDSTNMNTYSEGIEIAELGHAKDDDEVPIVNMSYSIDQKNGTPLFYETYMGSIIDNSQLTYMVDRAKEYGYENIGLILDRGYFSARNIRYIEKKGYDLIMMVKTNQKKISELITRHRLSIANQIDAYIEKYEIYGKTVKAKLYDDEKEYYVHIYYDGEKANEQRSMLLNSYAKLEKDLEKRISKTKLNRKEDMKRFEKGFRMYYDDSGYLRKYTKLKEKIQKEVDMMGYFAIVTTQEMGAGEALETYRDRDTVEKLFRSLKSELDFNKFRVHGDASMESKIFITFLANIVRNEVFTKTKEIRRKNKKDYTVPGIIHEMNKIEITRDSRNEYVRRYGLSRKQKEILKQFGITDEDVKNYVKEINEKMK